MDIEIKKIEKLVLLILCVIMSGCNSRVNQKETNENFEIDLSVKYNEYIKSYKIQPDGNAIVLINKIDNPPEMYKVKYDTTELISINKALLELPTTCDTVTSHYNDGTQYIAFLHKGDKNIKLVSNACKELKHMDTIVRYIMKSFDKMKKEEFYKSLKIIIPPTFPEVDNKSKI